MNAKKLVVDLVLHPREYMRVELIDRQRLGLLQFQFGLKVYQAHDGALVVDKAEYDAACRQQVHR